MKGSRRCRTHRLAAGGGGQADCEARCLALAGVHETWDASEPRTTRQTWGRRRYRSWDYDDDDIGDDDELDGNPDEYETGELIDAEGERHWTVGSTSLDGSRTLACPSPPARDVCGPSFGGSWPLIPRSTRATWAVGASTLDRWYHRGAVALWPLDRAFAVRAEGSPSWALDVLRAQIQRGDVAEAREAVVTVEPIWARVAARNETKALLGKSLRVAADLNEPRLAGILVSPFQLEQLRPNHARALSALVERYGSSWTADIIAAWSSHGRRRYTTGMGSREQFIESLPRLCTALLGFDHPGSVAASLLLDDAWAWVTAEVDGGQHASCRPLVEPQP